jgi:hypothetical protein
LRSEADDDAEEKARQQDVPQEADSSVENDEEAQRRSDGGSSEDAKKHGMEALRDKADCDTGDEPLDHGDGDDGGHQRSEVRVKEAAEAIQYA